MIRNVICHPSLNDIFRVLRLPRLLSICKGRGALDSRFRGNDGRGRGWYPKIRRILIWESFLAESSKGDRNMKILITAPITLIAAIACGAASEPTPTGPTLPAEDGESIAHAEVIGVIKDTYPTLEVDCQDKIDWGIASLGHLEASRNQDIAKAPRLRLISEDALDQGFNEIVVADYAEGEQNDQFLEFGQSPSSIGNRPKGGRPIGRPPLALSRLGCKCYLLRAWRLRLAALQPPARLWSLRVS